MIKADVLDRAKSFGLIAAATITILLAQVLATTNFAAAQDDNCDIDTTTGIVGGVECGRGDSQEGTTLFEGGGIFRTITNILLFLVGAISVIMLIIGGVRYVISGGDQQAVTNAKNTILYAIVGIVVAFLAYAAVQFVVNQLQTSADGGL